ARGDRATDQLRRVPREGSPRRRDRDRRRQLLELPSRPEALAGRLQLPDGTAPGVEPGMESAAARRAGLAAGRALDALREAGRAAARRFLVGAQRLDLRAP